MKCFLNPPPHSHTLDDWEQGLTCLDCDEPLCTYHCSEQQLQHQLCQNCFVEREVEEFNSSDCENGVLLDSTPADEWWDHAFEEAVEEEEHQAKRARHSIVSVRGQGHDDCSICHEAMKESTWTVTLPCFGSHQFHTECIQRWLTTQRQTCPLCNNQVNVVIESH